MSKLTSAVLKKICTRLYTGCPTEKRITFRGYSKMKIKKKVLVNVCPKMVEDLAAILYLGDKIRILFTTNDPESKFCMILSAIKTYFEKIINRFIVLFSKWWPYKMFSNVSNRIDSPSENDILPIFGLFLFNKKHFFKVGI